MKLRKIMKDNWLTREPNPQAFELTLFLVGFLFLSGFVYLRNIMGAEAWMAASPDSVFVRHEYWRLWTSLFAHGDLAHLFSNSLLFVPFAYLLMGYFGPILFPFVGLLLGGIINFMVLKTMPLANLELIGISGVVYWMGATWLTLFVMIEKRQSLRRRLFKVFFISFALFLPETYKPEISYLSHFIGYAFGILTGSLYYRFQRQKYLKAESFEFVDDSDTEINLQADSGSISRIQNWDHHVSKC